MSDYLPLEILDKVLKLLPVKSLIQYRSVSKTWKSRIDSSNFVHTYTRQQKQMQHHLLVRYAPPRLDGSHIIIYKETFISIVDDESFPLITVPLNSPPRFSVNCNEYYEVIGCSDGLLCFYSVTAVRGRFGGRVVIWNPCIRRAFEVDVPNVGDRTVYKYNSVLGFGVCPVTNDPKVVKISYVLRGYGSQNVTSVPCQVELFTLSTRGWRTLTGKLPRISVKFDSVTSRNYSVAVDGFVYWLATDKVAVDDGYRLLIVSFDTTSEEFGEVSLPNGLARSRQTLLMSKIRESLVILEYGHESLDTPVFYVWMMEGGLFTKSYTVNVNTPDVASVMGFNQRGDLILEIPDDDGGGVCGGGGELVVCERLSKQISKLGLYGYGNLFYVHPYMETLFLHDHPDLTVCTEAG